MKKINPIIQWWVTPKLPYHDVFELPLLIDKSKFAKFQHLFSQWIIHPIKRRLARLYLKLLQKFTDIKVIGITGSAGKTTTKEMLFSILRQQAPTVCTKTYLDPVYNIPNTILKTTPGTKYLILEMGVEYPGEMDFYLWLAKPDVGVITNVYPTHLEFLGDEDGVLAEKSKLVLDLDKTGIAVMKSDDKKLKKLKSKIKAKVVWFKGDENQLVEDGYIAGTIADSLGVTKTKIFEGLKKYKKPEHRLNFIKLSNGTVILDDSYNSNPQALLSTLKLFIKNAGKNNKIAILGDMKELGKYEEKLHRDVGKVISKYDFQVVVGVGESIKYLLDEIDKGNNYTKTVHVKSLGEALPFVKEYFINGNFVLIKGSRSIGLDKLVDALT